MYGRDPDVDFGPVRLTEQSPWSPGHRGQLAIALLVLFPFFGFVINTHVTGLVDTWAFGDRPPAVLPDRSAASVRSAYKRALRKYVPYYLYNFVLFPALAGSRFWKVLLGNVLAEVLRDLYSAATIFCGHVGHDVKSYGPNTRAHGRGQWYAMQVEATNNYEVPRPISILCGGLDRQIEHHLFPTLPPPRLREIAPEVRAICARYRIPYRTEGWGRTLRKALSHIGNLARQGGLREVVSSLT